MEQSPRLMDKVLSWDTSSVNLEARNHVAPAQSPSRSRSREFLRHQRRSPSLHSDRNYRRRSLSRSPERRYSSLRSRGHSRERYFSSPRRSCFRSNSRSRSRSRSRSLERMTGRVSRRDISPRTRRYEYPYSPPPRHSSPRRPCRRRDSRSPRRYDRREEEREKRLRESARHSESRHSRRSPRRSRYSDTSPRSRKIVLLSPKREGKQHRDGYGEERGHGSSRPRSRSPVKRRVKDRLGFRNEPITEVFNMDNERGINYSL